VSFFFYCAHQEPLHTVLLPVCCLHHLCDACPHRLASKVSTRSRLVTRSTLGSSTFTGVLAEANLRDLRFNGPRRFFGLSRTGCDLGRNIDEKARAEAYSEAFGQAARAAAKMLMDFTDMKS
jgi:hypothetical protein